MSGGITVLRAGPLATIQDAGRFGMLRYGIAASGPMVRGAFAAAGTLLGGRAGAAIEFTRTGLDFRAEGEVEAAFGGGAFNLSVNGEARDWNSALQLAAGDLVRVAPGVWGNYGYVRFGREIAVPLLLGSRATNSTVGLGGFGGRALVTGDRVPFGDAPEQGGAEGGGSAAPSDAPVRVVWGLHADLFPGAMRQLFVDKPFEISTRLDRMGVRLARGETFPQAGILSLVSDAVVPGDIQILGDGTPIVLMRDHQPTGGYPRIATVISADLDRFAQMRPGSLVRFEPVTLTHALAAGKAAR